MLTKLNLELLQKRGPKSTCLFIATLPLGPTSLMSDLEEISVWVVRIDDQALKLLSLQEQMDQSRPDRACVEQKLIAK
eukprot:2298572-Amphidinium_carterae.1